MSDLAPADIAARVVAWHNRHPLARRLRLADVHSMGHVALPFVDPAAPGTPVAAAGSLRERAMARARAGAPAAAAPAAGGPLQPAFQEDFVPPLAPAEVAAFAARHGIERGTEPVAAPVRHVPARAGAGGVVWRWVLTAELRSGAARTRVLLGAAPGAPVLGRRLWSLPRVGALAALGGATAALALALGLDRGLDRGLEPAPQAAVPAAATAAATSAASAALASAPAAAAVAAAPSAPSALDPAPAASASAAADAAAAEPAASRPPDVEPRLGSIELPPIGGIVEARRREAAARAAAAASDAGAAPPAAAASAPVYALTTRLLRTRTESQQIAEALTALLVVPGSPVQQVEVMKVGDDFRVVAWPYPARVEAERAQAALQARGHRLQLIAF
jgi:hypothetical protein